ncbi:MAG TPA: GNAT family N-acetyltransferase [Arachidicoccus sp.]|nr:GNAT family N-acetyltransferase [Arachidicoccus sp.]
MTTNIEQAGTDSIQIIQQIVRKTWPVTYGPILSAEQIDYMLDMIYSTPALEKQFSEMHKYYLLKEADQVVGFIDLQQYADHCIKLHKIYLLPEHQGKGYGRKLMDYAIEQAKSTCNSHLLLNVNRYNKALDFYQKMGFKIKEEVDTSIGQGYFMNDFVLELAL